MLQGTIDLATTVLDLQGARIPLDLDSQSLTGVLHGGQPLDQPVISTLNMTIKRKGRIEPHIFSTVLKRSKEGHVYKFVCCVGTCPYGKKIKNMDMLEQELKQRRWLPLLFDLTTDPLEQANILDSNRGVAVALAVTLPWPFTGCGLSTDGTVLDTAALPTTDFRENRAAAAPLSGDEPISLVSSEGEGDGARRQEWSDPPRYFAVGRYVAETCRTQVVLAVGLCFGSVVLALLAAASRRRRPDTRFAQLRQDTGGGTTCISSRSPLRRGALEAEVGLLNA